MKIQLILISILLFFSIGLCGQIDNTIDKGTGILYFSGIPGTTPDTTVSSYEAEIAFNTINGEMFFYDRDSTSWKRLTGIEKGFGNPTVDPGVYAKSYVNLTDGSFWRWNGAIWVNAFSSGGGGGENLDDAYNNIGANSARIFVDTTEGQTTDLIFDLRDGQKFSIYQNGDDNNPLFSAYGTRTGFGTQFGTEGQVNIINPLGENRSGLYITQNATEAGTNGIRVLSRSNFDPPAYFDMHSLDGLKRAETQLAHWESGIGSNFMRRNAPDSITKSPLFHLIQNGVDDTQPIMKITNSGLGNIIETDNWVYHDTSDTRSMSWYNNDPTEKITILRNGNLGILNNAPTYPFQNGGTSRFDDNLYLSDDNTYVGSALEGQIDFYSNGVNKFQITNTNTIQSLDNFKVVNGTLEITDNTETIFQANSSHQYPTFRINSTYSGSNGHPLISFRDNSLQRYALGVDLDKDIFTIGRTSINNDYFVMDAVGRIGIGTATPTESLDVTGNIKGSGNINLATGTNHVLTATEDIKLFSIDSTFSQSVKHVFRNNTQDILQIDSDGAKIKNTGIDNSATVLYGKNPTSSEIIEVTDLTGFTGASKTNAYGEMYIADSDPDTVTITSGTTIEFTDWTAGLLENFTYSSGRLTYTGTNTTTFSVSVGLSMEFSVNNTILNFAIYKNGVELPSLKMYRKLGSGSDIGGSSRCGLVSLATNDYIELFSDSDTNGDMIVTTANVLVSKVE